MQVSFEVWATEGNLCDVFHDAARALIYIEQQLNAKVVAVDAKIYKDLIVNRWTVDIPR